MLFQCSHSVSFGMEREGIEPSVTVVLDPPLTGIEPEPPTRTLHIETHYELLGRRSIPRWATTANYTAWNVFQYGTIIKYTTSPEDSNLFALDSFPTFRSGKQCTWLWWMRMDSNPVPEGHWFTVSCGRQCRPSSNLLHNLLKIVYCTMSTL